MFGLRYGHFTWVILFGVHYFAWPYLWSSTYQCIYPRGCGIEKFVILNDFSGILGDGQIGNMCGIGNSSSSWKYG